MAKRADTKSVVGSSQVGEINFRRLRWQIVHMMRTSSAIGSGSDGGSA